jgi:tetratricopeptide (TPR) repeat protein
LGLNPEKTKEAGIRINFGTLFEEWGHYNEAKSEYEKAIAILRELVVTKPEDAEDAEVVRYLARAHYNLGSLLADKLKKFDEAKGEFNEAIRIFKEAKKREPEFAEEIDKELALAHNRQRRENQSSLKKLIRNLLWLIILLELHYVNQKTTKKQKKNLKKQ